MKSIVLPVAGILLLTACTTESDPAADAGVANKDTASVDAPEPALGPVYRGEVGAIVSKRCAGCHQEGESAPFALDSFDALVTYADAAISAIEDERMPPWKPDRTCRTYTNERLVTAEELDTLRAWVADGKPEGDPAVEVPAPPAITSFEPTHTGASEEPYTPDPAIPDDWRCFVLDISVTEDSYMTALAVRPDATAVVHHALVYAVDASMRESLTKADAETPGAGYACFGGPNPSTAGASGSAFSSGASFPTQLGAWVPGSQPTLFAEGAAIAIRKDSVIVMQVHYNTLTAEPEADQTRVELRLTTEEPDVLFKTVPLAIPGIKIPAGDAASRHERVFRNYSENSVRIEAATGHMHMLGTHIEAQVERAGDSSECLVRIPDWDFNWQQAYGFLPGESAVVAPGEAVRVTCIYDNSAANQAVVNGQQLEPRDVEWGESTLDEMCLVYLAVSRPFEPPAAVLPYCSANADCIAACDDPRSLGCLWGCPNSNPSCLSCTAKTAQPCASECLPALLAVRSCLTDCGVAAVAFGGPWAPCLQESCPAEYEAFASCYDAALKSGACDVALEGCNVSLPE